MQLYLKLYAVCPFMATVHNLLISCWTCYWSWGTINKSPALCKWSTFPVYHLGKKTRIEPDQIEGVQEITKSVMDVIKYLENQNYKCI